MASPRSALLAGVLIGAAAALAVVAALTATGVLATRTTPPPAARGVSLARNTALLEVWASSVPQCGGPVEPGGPVERAGPVSVRVMRGATTVWSQHSIAPAGVHFVVGVVSGTYLVTSSRGPRKVVHVVSGQTYPIILPDQVLRCN